MGAARKPPAACVQVSTDCCAMPASTSTCWPVIPLLSSAARNSVGRATWPGSRRIFRHCASRKDWSADGADWLRLTAPAGEPISAGRSAPGLLREAANPPTACALANDHLACGALLGAQALGLRVPDDLALLGFGDSELAAHLAPGLTTMAPPRREIGERAAALLLAEPGLGAAPQRVVVDGPLVPRGGS